MIAGKASPPVPGVFCLPGPAYCILLLGDFALVGSIGLKVCSLHLPTGKCELQDFASDPTKHKDDQIVNISRYQGSQPPKLILQSKSGWFGIVRFEALAESAKRLNYHLEFQLQTEFVGFCAFPLLEFPDSHEEHIAPIKNKLKLREPTAFLVTNSLDFEAHLNLIFVEDGKLRMGQTLSQSCKFIEPPPVRNNSTQTNFEKIIVFEPHHHTASDSKERIELLLVEERLSSLCVSHRCASRICE